ncbi:ComEC/Rec2 family competence protein, partial [Nocardioides sp. P5_C9_2]
EVTVQTLWPADGSPPDEVGEESAANDASVVLLAEVRGVRILLTGDVEPSAQASLQRLLAGVEVDVLKVPHHGSRHQDLDLLLGVRARLALVSVGADNDYGHPSADVLAALTATGAQVRRTDLDGDILVTVDDGALGVRTRG